MALKIFWGSGSQFSWRVLLGAEIKGLEYESRLLEFSKGHMEVPEFLQMIPRGRVPVIRYESDPVVSHHFTSGYSSYTKEKCVGCGNDIQIHWQLQKIKKCH
jgi:hypothetical protein